MRNMNLLKDEVLSLLKSRAVASSDYIKSTEIVRVIPQLVNGKNLRDVINSLRQDQNPIISTSKGYKYSTDIVEVNFYLISLKYRIEDILKAYKGILKWFEIESNNNRYEADF